VDIAAISQPNEDGTAPPPVVAGRPLAKQLNALAATPTPMSEQKSYASLLVGSGFQGIVPLIILSSYYRGGWATAYCETGLAQWVFVFAWVGMGAVIYQFLINVWFWRINWKHYTTGGAAAVSETTRRKGRLDLSQLMIMCFNFIWFCSGQGMVWSTTGCAEEVYANITRGGWPGCATAGDSAGDSAGDERAAGLPLRADARVRARVQHLRLRAVRHHHAVPPLRRVRAGVRAAQGAPHRRATYHGTARPAFRRRARPPPGRGRPQHTGGAAIAAATR